LRVASFEFYFGTLYANNNNNKISKQTTTTKTTKHTTKQNNNTISLWLFVIHAYKTCC
jgi:hypothetical protein